MRRNEKIVKESIGNLSAELEAQELEGVVGGTISDLVTLTYEINKDITEARGCGLFVTVSYECFGSAC